MPELGHVAYYVRNLERSVAFYQKVVGLTVVARIFKGRAAVLSSGKSHHELLLIQVTTADGPLTGRRIGLYHVGWKVGDSLEDLREALDRAQTHGTTVEGTADHGMMFSLYLRDPDDNEVELFVDNPEYDWWRDTSWMEAPIKTLDLSLLRPYQTSDLRVSPQPAPSGRDTGGASSPSYGPGNQAGQRSSPIPDTESPTQQQSQARQSQSIDGGSMPLNRQDNRFVRSEEQGDDETYDESQDPDAIGYWLQGAQGRSQPVSAEEHPGEEWDDDEAYDESQDPDAIGYWLQGAQNRAQPVSAEGRPEEERDDDEAYDESQDPDAIGYWLQGAQNRPHPVSEANGHPQAEQNDEAYDELEDPDTIGYWLRRSGSGKVGKLGSGSQ